MRDILFTIANAGPHAAPLHLRVGAWETFIDVDQQVAVQFAHTVDQMVACVLEPRGTG